MRASLLFLILLVNAVAALSQINASIGETEALKDLAPKTASNTRNSNITNGNNPTHPLSPSPENTNLTLPPKEATDEKPGEIAIKLKWIDFWIALPGFLTTALLGFLGSRKRNEDGKLNALGKFQINLSIAVAAMLATVLIVAWALPSKMIIPEGAKIDRSMLHDEISLAVHDISSEIRETNSQGLRQELISSIRRDLDARFPISSFTTQREAFILREQIRLVQTENERLWRLISDRKDQTRGLINQGSPSPLLFTIQIILTIIVIIIGAFIFLAFKQQGRSSYQIDRRIEDLIELSHRTGRDNEALLERLQEELRILRRDFEHRIYGPERR